MSHRPHFHQLPGPALMFTKGQVIIKGKGEGNNKPRTQQKEATTEPKEGRGQHAPSWEETGERASWSSLHRSAPSPLTQKLPTAIRHLVVFTALLSASRTELGTA